MYENSRESGPSRVFAGKYNDLVRLEHGAVVHRTRIEFSTVHPQVLNNVTKSGMLLWINDQLQAVSSQLERCTTEEEFVLDLLLLCATFAENDPEIALDFIGKGLYGCLLSILNACQVKFNRTRWSDVRANDHAI